MTETETEADYLIRKYGKEKALQLTDLQLHRPNADGCAITNDHRNYWEKVKSQIQQTGEIE